MVWMVNDREVFVEQELSAETVPGWAAHHAELTVAVRQIGIERRGSGCSEAEQCGFGFIVNETEQ